MGFLRFILAIAVVIAHSSPIFGLTLVGGKVAVQTFYIISGFYMSLILSEKYVGRNNSYRLFITNRLLRLYPIYWVVLILTIVLFVCVTFFYPDKALSSNSVLSYFCKYLGDISLSTFVFLIFTNVFILFQDLVMFLGLDTSSGSLFFSSNFYETSPELYRFLFVPQAWTIGVEIAFYLIAPIIVKRKSVIIGVLIVASLGLRLVLFKYGFRDDPWSYRFFPTELVFFLIGVISYRLKSVIDSWKIDSTWSMVLWLGIIAATFTYNSGYVPFKFYYYISAVAIFLPMIFKLTKNWKLDRYIGELSYPIYISHKLVIWLMEGFDIKFSIGFGASATILTVLFSISLNELVAKKIELYRQRRLA